ncbi:hypothetical protein N657DRAFT_632743 [Parathielavia appendiculata]|uniref:Uncharacterized protein n=1 Tax=Parathielavia appendiculata TaxID=2587402 RepID=A0AAN6U1X4_9PEZI|nr:hypothetical protein N657DRAFT_632743 [Parathielavia appendiculata]
MVHSLIVHVSRVCRSHLIGTGTMYSTKESDKIPTLPPIVSFLLICKVKIRPRSVPQEEVIKVQPAKPSCPFPISIPLAHRRTKSGFVVRKKWAEDKAKKRGIKLSTVCRKRQIGEISSREGDGLRFSRMCEESSRPSDRAPAACSGEPKVKEVKEA